MQHACWFLLVALFFCDLLFALSEENSPETGRAKPDGPLLPVDVLMTFTKAEKNLGLQSKFKLCISSMLHHATGSVNLNVVGDKASRDIADSIIKKLPGEDKKKVKVFLHDMEPIARGVTELLADLIKYFRYSPDSYYGDNLFFISTVLHSLAQFKNAQKMIMLDSDLKFKDDIANLNAYFSEFSDTELIGIARDGQPVYRHVFSAYRSKNKGTKIGDPPPDGITGFNSGVLLLDLAKIRKADDYLRLISVSLLEELVHKYSFKGHLGDQDFYTLLSTEYSQFFHILPCNWNRQLCTWWKDHGYKDVFDEYYRCDGDIKIYHGNCNTPIPED